jgi:CHAD domain-containing protein
VAADGRHSPGEAIHEIRLLIKRVRALLWFARPSLSRTVEAAARKRLHQAAHFLSGQRDLKAAQTTFEKILEEVDSAHARAAVKKTTQALREKNSGAADHSSETLASAVKVFRAAIDEVAHAVERSAKWPSATKRTEKAFRVMRKTGKKARRSQDDADFHAWRKKTKRLLYLLELRDTDPSGREKRLLERVDKLQSTLGDDHDCVVAAHHLPAPAQPRDVARKVKKLLGARQRRLRKESSKLARRIDAAV